MNNLAFAASNNSAPINRKLVGYAVGRFQDLFPDAEFEFLDLNDFEMPIYSVDREDAEGVHLLANALYKKIWACDGIIVSFVEYNGFVTSTWKNIFYWMSRIDQKVWQDRPVVLLAATPGPRTGANTLKTLIETAPFFGMAVKGVYGVGLWSDIWDGANPTGEADVVGVDNAVKGLLH